MKTHKSKMLIYILFILTIMNLFTACSSTEKTGLNSEQSNKSDLTIQQVANNYKALIYEANTLYNYETDIIGADGKNYTIDGLSILNVEKKDTFQAGSTTLNNVIAIQFYGDFDSVKTFMENTAFIQVADKDGKENSKFDSGVWSDGTNDYMLFYSESEVGDYAILGGFAEDKNNGYSKVVFEL